jgi:cation transporter-like permease
MFIGSVFWGTSVMEFPGILFTVIATSGIGLLIYLLTERMVFTAFCRGLDLERFIHPLTIVLSGILITGLYVLMLKLSSELGIIGWYGVISISSLSIAAAVISAVPGLKNKNFRLFVRKPMVAFVLVAFVSIVAGTIFKKISSLGLMKPELYTAYPALVLISINVGLFIGSTATTKLALGLLKPSLRAVRNHGTQIFAGWITSMIAFAILSGFLLTINGAFSVYMFGHLLAILLTVNVVAIIPVVLVSYALAVLTFQRGLELDSFAVPIENSLAILILTTALLVVLVALQ